MLGIVWRKLCSIRRRLKIAHYNDFTIAEHFRSLGARIGNDNRLLIRSLGTEPYLIKIGNHCTISVGVVLLTHDGGTWVFTDEISSLQSFGTIEIGDNCFIGANAILLPGVKVGSNSIVGTGAVVTKDVPPSVVVAGCPARIICSIEEYKQKVLAIWKIQKPKGYMNSLKPGHRYSPAEIEARKLVDAYMLREHLIKKLWPQE